MKRYAALIAIVVVFLLATSIPGSGKGPPSPDIAVRVTISGQPDALGGYSIVSDDRGAYVDGEQGVTAKVASGGLGQFTLDPATTTMTNPRAIWFDFSNKIANGTIANPWSGPYPVKLDCQMVADSVGSVPVGGTGETDGRFGEIYAGPGKKEPMFRVVFNPDPNGPYFYTVNAPNTTSPIVVTHPDCNTWTLTPKVITYGAGAGTGAVSSFVKFVDPAVSAGQYLMPYQVTLTRKVPITCP
jgi:hypothetical protein